MAWHHSRINRRTVLGAVRLAFFLLLATSAAEAKRLIPHDNSERVGIFQERAERWREVRELLGAPHVHPPGLEAGEALREAGDTLHVMVCRLAFETNRDSTLTTISPDGGFMMDPGAIPEWQRLVDPPPHDTAYFNAHMNALAEYIKWQSYGKVVIDWDILPAGDETFLMSDIADYGPGEGNLWTLELLETFMREGLDLIDGDLQGDPSGPRFADYDHVMIFHAGSDLQNDIAQDSPNDLPSFNIFFGDPDGSHPVDGGETLLESVLLLPETTIQDVTEDSPLGALNAVTAHEFTHQLGTVDTYNTYYFWPVVGYWDLMDSGHQLVMGLETSEGDIFSVYGGMPTSLAIWHKEYLGWISEEEGTLARLGGGEGDFTLAASGLQSPGIKALRVDLCDSEYFLLENRQEQLWEGDRYLEQDDETGVIQYMADWVSEENIGEYDFLIPQSGLLAWHVDERNLQALMDVNAINMYEDWHFWLTEADGGGELGNPYSWNWRGNDGDPFYEGNFQNWDDESIPSTRLKDKSPSGFTLTNLVTSDYLENESAVDSTISFHASLVGPAPGFPRDDRDRVPEALDLYSARNSLMPLGEAGLAYAMVVLEPDSTIATSLIVGGREASTPVQEPLPRFTGRPLTSGLLENFFDDRDYWFVFTADSLLAWSFDEGGEGLFLDLAWPLDIPILAGPIAGDDFLLWLDAAGGLNMLSADKSLRRDPGDREGELIAYSPPALWEGPDGQRVLIQLNDKIYAKDPASDALEEFLSLPEGRTGVAWIRVMDRNGDDVDDIFWVERSGFAGSWGSDNQHGFRDDPLQPQTWFQFPVDGDSLIGGPAVGDMDADGVPELFLSTRTRIYRFSTQMHEFFPQSQLYTDWPLRPAELLYLDEAMQVGGPVLLADMTGDGASELIVFGHTGHLIIVDENARPVLGTPRSMAGEGPADLYAVNGSLRAASWKGYMLGFDAAGDGSEAEWGLPGGGSGRRGRWERRHAYAPVTGATAADEWILYPNPAQDWVRLQHAAADDNLTLQMELYDLEGQLRLEKIAYSSGGPLEIEFDLGDLAAGVYFLRVEVLVNTEPQYSFVKRVAVLR